MPKMLWTDKGKEFCNQHVEKLLKIIEERKQAYSTESEEKSSVIERWNRPMKERMWKMFTANNNTIYFNKINRSTP